MKPSSRPALVGAVTGAVLLVVVIAFAVFLPKAEGDDTTGSGAASATPALSALPPSLSHGLTAIDSLPPSTAATALQQAAVLTKAQATGVTQLQQLYGVPSAVRFYTDSTLQHLITVAEIAAAPGPFLPQGPPIAPALQNLARGNEDLVDVNGLATCDLGYSQTIPAGSPVTPDVPTTVNCQLKGGTTTWQLSGSGLNATDAVDILQTLAGRV